MSNFTAEHLERDGYKRGKIMQPDGTVKPYSRISTVSNGLKDTFQLTNWAKRNVALGVARNYDIQQRVLQAPETPVGVLNGIVNEAEERAGGKDAANKGSYIHELTEILDRGETVEVPLEYRHVLDAYTAAVNGAELRAVSAEQFVVIDELEICGSYDRQWYTQSGLLVVGDLKTGKSAPRYAHQIAIQLAMYAHGTLYDPSTGERQEQDPQLSKEVGLLIHAPLTGGCDLYELDIAEAWEWAKTIVRSRRWQKETISKEWSK